MSLEYNGVIMYVNETIYFNLFSRDGISDVTGQELEAGHPVGYSVILSQLRSVTRLPLGMTSTVFPFPVSGERDSSESKDNVTSLALASEVASEAIFNTKYLSKLLEGHEKCSKIAHRSPI